MTTFRLGLERVALDLHVHTPASHDWEDAKVDPIRLVDAVVQKGLHGIAVTDHSTGEWIDALRNASKARGIVVFPGVELNNLAGNEGIHIVALFDPDFTSADADRFLTQVGALTGTGAKLRRGSATVGPIALLDAVEEFGGIAVLAHCATSKGALGSMRGELRTQIVQHRALLAAEAPPEDYHDADKRSRRKRTWDVLDGRDSTYQRELAVYSASDNPSPAGHGHALASIGRRFTYFRMERPITLEGLRQCLVDRTARIEIPHPGASVEPAPPRQAPSIAAIRVTGGYLDGLDLGLHEGLTTILGAKGSGKSLLVELLRFALGQEPTDEALSRDHTTKLEKRLLPYGRVEVDVRQPDGSVVTVEREYDPSSGNPWRSPVSPTDIMTCHFLSQGEVVRIAESNSQQLEFIDSFFDFRMHQKQIAETRLALSELDRQVASRIASLSQERELLEQAKQLSAEVRAKGNLIKSKGFDRYQRAQAKSRFIDEAISSATDVIEALQGTKAGLEAIPDGPVIPAGLGRDGQVRRVRNLAETARQSAMEAIAQAREAATESLDSLSQEQAIWQREFVRAQDEYSKQVQKAGGDQAALGQARARLETELASVKKRLSQVSLRAQQLRPSLQKRQELLERLSDLHADYTAARQERCEWFEDKSGGRIKARVSAASNTLQFRDRLSALKKGSYLAGPEIDAIATAVAPDLFVTALLHFSEGKDPKALKRIVSDSKLPETRVVALAEFLLEQASEKGFERLLELQHAVTPTDQPDIRFRREDGSFAPLSELSTGQKCTALLIMALAEGDRPIIVDQPEDSLDVRSIWEDMCLRLRLAKTTRQFVFTTHNSSLAVASDSDMFVVMVGSAARGKVGLAGAIDHEEIRDEVIALLEGGEGPYFLKQRKYHISDPYGRP